MRSLATALVNLVKGVLFGALRGWTQSVPMAELHAMIMLLRVTVGCIRAFSDSESVVNGWKKGRPEPAALSGFSMADLWILVWNELDGRQGSLQLEWVPSPQEAQEVGLIDRVVEADSLDTVARQIAQQWARCSLRKSVWAVAYWQQIRPRCASEHDAYRRLANRWLAVLWKLWQSRELYDEAYHLQQRRLRSQPLA